MAMLSTKHCLGQVFVSASSDVPRRHTTYCSGVRHQHMLRYTIWLSSRHVNLIWLPIALLLLTKHGMCYVWHTRKRISVISVTACVHKGESPVLRAVHYCVAAVHTLQHWLFRANSIHTNYITVNSHLTTSPLVPPRNSMDVTLLC